MTEPDTHPRRDEPRRIDPRSVDSGSSPSDRHRRPHVEGPGATTPSDRLEALARLLATSPLPTVSGGAYHLRHDHVDGPVATATARTAEPIGDRTTSALVGVAWTGDTSVELWVRPVDGDPALAFRGFTAPPEWDAVGMVGTGRVRCLAADPVDRPTGGSDPAASGPIATAPDATEPTGPGVGTRPSSQGDVDGPSAPLTPVAPVAPTSPVVPPAAGGPTVVDGQRVALASLTGRDGRSVQVLQPDGDDPTVLWSEPDDVWHGRIADAQARALGLPTAPPAGTPAQLWTLLWLDAVLGAALTAPGRAPLRFDDLAVLHPAAALTGRSGDHLALPGQIESLTRQVVDGWPWPALRRAVAEGRVTLPGIAAGDASWFDDGSFERAATEGFPDTRHLLDDLRATLPAVTYLQVLRAAADAIDGIQAPLAS